MIVKMRINLQKRRQFNIASFYNPGAEINKLIYLMKTLDLGVFNCLAPNPIKSLREYLNILDRRQFWKW